jgi:hypothetical protein
MATLQQEKAALQKKEILLLKAQERAQQPSAASGECALCVHEVALMAAMAVTSMRQLLPGSQR